MTTLNVLTQPALAQDRHGHDGFLPLLPVVERHASIAFRHLPPSHREEAVAEAVAAAFESYVRLRRRGTNPVHDFPTRMAKFAVLHVKNDRHVGTSTNSKDALSLRGQKRRGFHVRSVFHPSRVTHESSSVFEEQLQDDSLTPIPDQAAFRIDFACFLQKLSGRDRQMAEFLGLGHTGRQAARRFQLTPGRVSQLRERWCREWHGMHEKEFSA